MLKCNVQHGRQTSKCEDVGCSVMSMTTTLKSYTLTVIGCIPSDAVGGQHLAVISFHAESLTGARLELQPCAVSITASRQQCSLYSGFT